MDAVDSVAREQEGVQARGEGEVGEDADVVVGEVDGILILLFLQSSVSPTTWLGCCWKRKGGGSPTFAAPRFSMAGILWPMVLS